MKLFAKLLSSATVICTVLSLNVSYGKVIETPVGLSQQMAVVSDTVGALNKLRVVFIPNSTYKNFKIGIESNVKTDVNIQVINQKGLVVYSDLLERVSKKLEEIDFSFLKKGEYIVKVTNEKEEFSKTLVIP
jgi:hypothetical protein